MIKELEKIYISPKWLSNLRTKDDFTKDVEDVIKLLNGKRVNLKQFQFQASEETKTKLKFEPFIDEIKKIKLAKKSKFLDPYDTENADGIPAREYEIGRDIKKGRERLCILTNRFITLLFIEENLLATENFLADENSSKEKLVELRQLWGKFIDEYDHGINEKGKNIQAYLNFNSGKYLRKINEAIGKLGQEIAKKSGVGIKDKIKEVELEIEDWENKGFKNIDAQIQARGVNGGRWLATTNWKAEAQRIVADKGISAKEAIEASVGLPLSEAVAEWLINEKKFEKFNQFQTTPFWAEETFSSGEVWNKELKRKYNNLVKANEDDKIVEEVSKVKKAIGIDEISKNVLEKRTYFASSDANNFDPDPLYWENLKNELDCDAARELVDEVRELGDELVEYDERIAQVLTVLGYAEKYPDFEGYQDEDGKMFYWTQLENNLQRSARDDNSLRSLEDLINIIANIKEHLGFSDDELDNLISIADLAIPTKKVDGVDTQLTLKELIQAYNESGDKTVELDKARKELVEEKAHRAAEKQQWEETTKQKVTEKETEILSYLNDNLKLFLNKSNINKESVLAKIQELIAAKPPATAPNLHKEKELERKITKLEEEITELKNLDKIIKQAMVQQTEKIFRDLGIIASSMAMEKENISVKQVAEIRDNLIKVKFNELKNSKDGAKNLNIILGILLLGTLTALVRAVIKGINSPKIGSKVKSKK